MAARDPDLTFGEVFSVIELVARVGQIVQAEGAIPPDTLYNAVCAQHMDRAAFDRIVFILERSGLVCHLPKLNVILWIGDAAALRQTRH